MNINVQDHHNRAVDAMIGTAGLDVPWKQVLLLSAQRDQIRAILRLRRQGTRRVAERAALRGSVLVVEQAGKGDPLTLEPVTFDTLRPLARHYANSRDAVRRPITARVVRLGRICSRLWCLFVQRFEAAVDHMRYTFDLHCIVVLYAAIAGKYLPDGATIVPRVAALAAELPWGQNLVHFGIDPDTVEGAVDFFESSLDAIMAPTHTKETLD
jgi:hypothetical protein